MLDTYALITKAMDICIREKGFPSDTLEALILNGIRDLAGAEIKRLFSIRDGYAIMGLYAYDIDTKFGELKESVDSDEFEIHNESHMKMLEEWMSTKGYPNGRMAAWTGAGGRKDE